jgi:hypothetical protein
LRADVRTWKALADMKVAPGNAWGIDGFAIVESTVSGTHKGALGLIPATGKPFSNWHSVDVYQPTAEGKVRGVPVSYAAAAPRGARLAVADKGLHRLRVDAMRLIIDRGAGWARRWRILAVVVAGGGNRWAMRMKSLRAGGSWAPSRWSRCVKA